MDQLAQAKSGERAELFQETAARMGISSLLVEKDFWICWILKAVFELENQPGLIFKGGTSLSKVFGLIDRLSEDVDLAFDRADLGFGGDKDPEQAPSRKKANRLIDELKAACTHHITDKFLPALRKRLQDSLSPGWELRQDHSEPQTLNFAYPQDLELQETSYIAREVRLELGARSDHWPSCAGSVRPYVAEHFPGALRVSTTTVNTLEARRTFWEKATLLHAMYHRPEPEKYVSRQSRHYYDLARLAASRTRNEALGDLSLLERVILHKTKYFPSGWSNYDSARPGSLRLVPGDPLARLLRRDYESMEEMFMNPPPSFAELITTLRVLEDEINQSVAPD